MLESFLPRALAGLVDTSWPVDAGWFKDVGWEDAGCEIADCLVDPGLMVDTG